MAHRRGHPPKTKESTGRRKVERVMHEFKGGGLYSSSGKPVTNKKQAIAIALSEQRRANRRNA
jgi:hypothetical protein